MQRICSSNVGNALRLQNARIFYACANSVIGRKYRFTVSIAFGRIALEKKGLSLGNQSAVSLLKRSTTWWSTRKNLPWYPPCGVLLERITFGGARMEFHNRPENNHPSECGLFGKKNDSSD
ncbi:unnamed protein product [Nippostrongylus brasiliensis]|uniref:Uncharacterized protein n=1 Tax=Nippostrongylus brasiliensis TaxID=27835 RepID=A0A0N4XJ49_NIPBR|nr:unnamed protein product [Nippostrongylus brasiliensis]